MSSLPFRFNLNLPQTPELGPVDQNLLLEINRIYIALRQIADQVENLVQVVRVLEELSGGGTPAPIPIPPPVPPSITFPNIASNHIFVGPRSGDSPAKPAFRRMFSDDFPLPAVYSDASTVFINWRTSNSWSGIVDRNTVFSFVGAPDMSKCTLIVIQDSVGGHTLTLPANVRYNTIFPGPVVFPPAPNTRFYLGFIYDKSTDSYDLVALA